LVLGHGLYVHIFFIIVWQDLPFFSVLVFIRNLLKSKLKN